MRTSARLGAFACAAVLAVAATACRKEEGPGEKAGKAIDDAMRDSAETMGRASDAMGRSMRDAGKAMEEAGRKMEEERNGR